MDRIWACITTRDNRPDKIVYDRLSAACRYVAQQQVAAAELTVVSDGYSVAHCRNKAVVQMLAKPERTHLFFCDDDVTVQADVLEALVNLDADIAVGCYPSYKLVRGGGPMAVPYLTVKKDGQWVPQGFDGVAEVDGAGTGCMLIKRKVLEAIDFPWFVWRERLSDGRMQTASDDIDFCDRAIALGFRILAHGNVRCGHNKTVDMASFISLPGEEYRSVSWTGPQSIAQQEAWPVYGSHVPALVTVSHDFPPIRSVVEYGCGRYSTPAFLNRDYFPDLETLVSVETNEPWAEDTRRRNADDRLRLIMCEAREIAEQKVPAADLIFIDCDDLGFDRQERFRGRLELLKRYEALESLVAVHDADFPEIGPAVGSSLFKHKAIFKPRFGTPTAVLSNRHEVERLQWLDIKPNAPQLCAT
jgi:hypothetical protein